MSSAGSQHMQADCCDSLNNIYSADCMRPLVAGHTVGGQAYNQPLAAEKISLIDGPSAGTRLIIPQVGQRPKQGPSALQLGLSAS